MDLSMSYGNGEWGMGNGKYSHAQGVMNIECEKTNTVGVNGRIPPTKFTKIPPKFRAS